MKFLKSRKVLVLTLVCVLALVGYLNYELLFKEDAIATDDVNKEETPINAELVSNETEQEVMTEGKTLSDEFFVDYKIERDKSRSEHIAMLDDISKEEDTDGETKDMAQQEAVSLVKISEQEMVVENLIRSKGFNDAIVFIHNDYVNVVVDAQQITAAQAAQIQDIVNKECGIAIEKISIAVNNSSNGK